jgi:hypothetical protein
MSSILYIKNLGENEAFLQPARQRLGLRQSSGAFEDVVGASFKSGGGPPHTKMLRDIRTDKTKNGAGIAPGPA